MKPIRTGIIGIGGFAVHHIASAQRCQEQGLCEIGAVVARLPHNPAYEEEEREEELRRLGVRIYRSYEEMFAREEGKLDLVTVPLGIMHHAPASIAALEAGFNVLCEKPAAGSTTEALEMQEVQRRTGLTLSIGYQHLLTPGIQGLKRAALEGRFGRLLEARTVVQWPRSSSYYTRNEWAGRLSAAGRQVLDSPIQNAAAHFLQNMLYVAGPTLDQCAHPVEVYGENYHANRIESADTQFARIRTDTGVTMVFAASHALRRESVPQTIFRFENATVVWDIEADARIVRGQAAEETELAHREPLFDGYEVHDYPLVDTLHAIGDGRCPTSTIENSLQHVACVESVFASSEGVHPIPETLCETIELGSQEADDAPVPTLTAVEGMAELLGRCFDSGLGPGELGVTWARAGVVVRPEMEPGSSR